MSDMLKRFKSSAVDLLRWSEKYTKTDMVYLASGGFLSLLYQGSSLIAAFVLAIAIGHIVPQEVYGQYKYILSIIGIVSLFSLNGLGTAVMQSTARGFDSSLESGFWINLRWSAFATIAAVILATYYFYAGNMGLAIGILIGGCMSPVLASANLYTAFLAGKKDFVRQIGYSILDNIIPVGIFILVIFFTKDPTVLVATYFLSNVLAALFFYRRTIALYRPAPGNIDRSMLSYGKHLSLMGIIGGIADNLDQILLFHYVGAAQLAIYNFATAIPDQIKGPLKTVNAMIMARFSGGDVREIRGSMWNKFLWLFLFTSVATVLYVVLAPLAFRILFPAYAQSVFYTQLYALWMISASLDPASVYLIAKKKIRDQYILNGTLSIFQIISMVIGAIGWGILGVVVARLFSKWVFAIVSFVLYQRAVHRDDVGTIA
ncbi:MAG: hypothetical protein JWM46_283 [Candidatus Kaiserbacteria bacterium]|nr:hypothetical protein [Candidatus Kaiserbacteria bacterium]